MSWLHVAPWRWTHPEYGTIEWRGDTYRWTPPATSATSCPQLASQLASINLAELQRSAELAMIEAGAGPFARSNA